MNTHKAGTVPGQIQQDKLDVAAVVVGAHSKDINPKATTPSMVDGDDPRAAEWSSVLPEQYITPAPTVTPNNPNPCSNSDSTASPTPTNSWMTSFNLSYFLPRILALSVAATWGTNFPTVKYLQESLNGLDSPTAATIRFGLAGIALTPVLFDFGKGRIKELPQLIWVDGLLAGLATFGGYLCQSVALEHIGAGKAAFLCSLNVIVVPLMKRLWDTIFPGNNSFTPSDTEHEHIKSPGENNPWLPAMLAVAGVGVLELLGHNGVSASFGWDELEWDLVAFGQAIGFGVGYLINEHAVKKEPKLVMDFTAVQLVVIALCAGVWTVGNNMAMIGPDASVWQGAATLSAAFGNLVTPPFDWKTIGAIGYTGLISTAFMIWLSNKVLNDLTASEFSVLISSEPLFASTFAFLLLKEPIGINLIAGGALIISACLLEVLGFEKIKRAIWPKKQEQKQQ